MPKIELTNGAWAELRDADTLKNRDRKRVMVAIDQVEGGEITKSLAVVDQLIAELVESWSFELPLPRESSDSVDELSVADYDLLVDALEPARKVLFPDFDPSAAAGTPTGPSRTSNGSLGADRTTNA